MNERDYEKLNDLVVSFDQFIGMVELAENMAADLACGNVTDDEERARLHINRLWALTDGLVQISHIKAEELNKLLELVPIVEDAPCTVTED